MNPYESPEECASIVVESPSDVFFIDELNLDELTKFGAEKWYQPTNLTSQEFKNQGNELFKKKEYNGRLKNLQHGPKSYGVLQKLRVE